MLFVDLETTGLNPSRNGIIAISYIITNNNYDIVEAGTIEMNTLEYASSISDEALNINGYTKEQILSFNSPLEALDKFVEVLKRTREGATHKMIAYNSSFDFNFINAWFKHYGRPLGEYVNYGHIDMLALSRVLNMLSLINTKDNKLTTIADYFNIQHIINNSASDVRVLYDITKIMNENLVWKKGVGKWKD